LTQAKRRPQQQERLSAAEVKSLYQQCLEKEQRLPGLKRVQELLPGEFAFGQPLFLPDPPGISEVEKLIRAGHKYQSLLERCRNSQDIDTILSLIARWLKHEGKREPEDWIPGAVLRRLLPTRQLQGFPWTDLYHASQIDVWLPYTESLMSVAMSERKKRSSNPSRELLAAGYSPDSVKAAVRLVVHGRTRSPVELVCQWLAERKKKPSLAETLRNAYSRRQRRHMPICSFCKQPAISEFYWEKCSVPYCSEHSPDQLPPLPMKPG
jgi:hypothetical protein